jgi:hypothetical protein
VDRPEDEDEGEHMDRTRTNPLISL